MSEKIQNLNKRNKNISRWRLRHFEKNRKTFLEFCVLMVYWSINNNRGWIKEVGVRSELRGTLVRAIAIAIAYISLWSVLSYNYRYVHVPLNRPDQSYRGTCTYLWTDQTRAKISMNVVRAWYVRLITLNVPHVPRPRFIAPHKIRVNLSYFLGHLVFCRIISDLV